MENEGPRGPTETARASWLRPLQARVRAGIATRLSPARTREATLVERLTVSRLSWTTLVRLNRYLEFLGRLATGAYIVFIATLLFGVSWKQSVEDTLNSGDPVRGAVALAVILPTLLFVALHSLTGYGRWRVQRELWRRDVERLESISSPSASSPGG